jgi:dTDP-4-amino-4,6-dideoxygalactose transaminase
MIPFFNLSRQYESIKGELDSAVHEVMKSGFFTLGKNVAAFENEYSEFINVDYACGVASGTDALTIAMKALDLGHADEVILPANSYPSAFGIALSGVKIRLVDCDENGLMDSDKLAKIITSKTRAVLPVHMYGNPADLVRIAEILSQAKTQIYLVEDAAQAHGAEMQLKYDKKSRISQKLKVDSGRDWVKAGSVGDISIFSFYPSKNLGAGGDGGLVVTNDKNLAEKIKQLRMYGESARYVSEEISGVSRLDEMQAAILRAKLPYLSEWNKRRQEIAKLYESELENTGDLRFIATSGKSCRHLFVIQTKKRMALQKYLANEGIGTAIHYPVPIHLTKSFKTLGYKAGDFPMAEKLSREVLSLPLFPELKDNEVYTVIKAIRKFFKSK